MTDVVLFEEYACAANSGGNSDDQGKKIAVATLNSPRSLNALSGAMIDLLYPQLQKWQAQSDIVMVLLQGAGEKAFCAGGDIVHMFKEMQQHVGEYAPGIEEYFVKEYQLDYLIHSYQKPVIVWGNGIVMGGGLGLMAGASHRVVTENSRIAMPEISIGLYPDVGGTYFLNKMPDDCGLFLGLTGASINAADAKYCQLADHFIAQENQAELVDSLLNLPWHTDVENNNQLISALFVDLETKSIALLPESNLKTQQALINQVMAFDNLNDIVEAILSTEIDHKWFNRAQKSLKNGSALSAHIAYQQLKSPELQGIAREQLTLADCFRIELNLSVNCGQFGEFVEGVRALLIDKDNQPKWRFNSIATVDSEVVEWFFSSLWSPTEHPLAKLSS